MENTSIHIGRICTRDRWSANKHSHPFTEIIIISSGQIGFEINREQTIGRAGDVAQYPPGAIHREYSLSKSIDFYYLTIGGPCEPVPEYFLYDEGRRLRILAQWIFEEQGAHSAPRRCIESLSAAFMAEMNRLSHLNRHGAMEKVRSYMKEHLSEPLSLYTLSSLVSLTRCHFLRRYKAYTGRTPIEDLQMIRVQTAYDLLLTTDRPIKEIASITGFCDEYYFSRVFKRLRLVTPGSIRKRRW